MKTTNEIFYTDIGVFFDAIRSYAAEIDGKVLCADKVPYIGFVVYHDGDAEDEKAKHFMIDCKYAKNVPESIMQILNTNNGKINIAKSLEPKKDGV